MKISVEDSDNAIRRLAAAIAYFVCLVAFYIDIGQDMGAKYFLPLFLPMTAALFLLQWATRTTIFARENLPNLLTCLGWCSAFPIIYTWTYAAPWYMSLVSFDFVIGTTFLLFLTSLEGLLAKTLPPAFAAAVVTALNFLLLAIPFVEYAYYVMVWHSLSPASLMSLYMTNWRESIDFIEANVGAWFFVIIGTMFFLLRLAWRSHVSFCQKLAANAKGRLRTACLSALAVISFGTGLDYFLDSSIVAAWNDVVDYAEKTREYGERHAERHAALVVDAKNALPAKLGTPHTIIVVIGESASRDYMKAFTEDFIYDDTPWLSAHAADEDFIVFKNCYSSWSQTVPSLERALTEESQYNGKDFLDSVSVIDAAKKAGYTAYWFSNQGRYGQYDSIVTLIAKTADVAEWTDDSYTFTDKYDIALLDFLKNLDPHKNNFVVLHIMGSHIYYYNRYPYSFAKWKTEDGTGMATAAPSYANSILYTDYVLSEIFAYAKQNLNLAAMIYFSDHGENLHISHNPDVFSFDMVRIPMFFYLSPEYRSKMPAAAKNLRRRENEFFTNDMIYDTLCGVMAAPSNRYESRQDFSSADYDFTKETLTTMLGQQKITDDPKIK